MLRHNDVTAPLDSKARRKQQDERRMRFRRAIESYTEQRQLHAELDDYADTLVFNSLIESSAGRRSAPPAH
ncbi:Uncharacterised protein [Streptococcus pneumoniae]|jgi:hypothetical protein|uniref:Uncharacterized protein n=2 Tax=Stutzerimonas stutzeri TaxID=316 RepID=A4VFZ0_STUS1|nr:hypothetical protein [Stutzerimonas stutzeri]MBW8336438.1 hypothetical protein [Pseudomonas sp.]MCJ0876909.1 hypothetical protein [Pseudomonas sp. JI-2]NMY64505.1 hypothetical protein [Pseudomonas sp. WS 5018]CJL28574.1 Uncharacterised protein [Streptococcus pneumoniae]ABP77891.1 conserved hypothetical protein [Stutzerimonas stutzeri A1501]